MNYFLMKMRFIMIILSLNYFIWLRFFMISYYFAQLFFSSSLPIQFIFTAFMALLCFMKALVITIMHSFLFKIFIYLLISFLQIETLPFFIFFSSAIGLFSCLSCLHSSISHSSLTEAESLAAFLFFFKYSRSFVLLIFLLTEEVSAHPFYPLPSRALSLS